MNSSKTIKALILLLLLVIFFILVKNLSDKDKNYLNSAVSSVIASWPERAQSATKRTIELSKEAMAISIIGTLHPTASNAKLSSYDVEVNGDVIIVLFFCTYSGGFTGNDYSLKVKWRFSNSQNFGIIILSDTSPISYDNSNFEHLKNYFQSEIYPIVMGNIH